MATRRRRTGRSRSDEASARASGRSSAGLVDGQAAGQVRVDVVAAEARCPPAGRARRSAAPGGSGRGRWRVRARRAVARRARRAPGPRRAAAGCPRASARRRCPGAGSSCSTRNARAGSATSARPSSPISKTPTSSVEPKRFFDARSSRSAAVPLAFEVEDGVDEVLERLRAGEASRPWSRARRGRPRSRRPWRAPSAAAPTRGPGRRCRPGRRARRRVAVWIESTTSSAGPLGARELGDPPDLALGDDADARRRRARRAGPSRAARRRTWAADSSPVA